MCSEMSFECAGSSVRFTAKSTQVWFANSAVVITVAVLFRLEYDALVVLRRQKIFRFYLSVNFKLFFSKVTRRNFLPHSPSAKLSVLSNMCSFDKMVSRQSPEVATSNSSPALAVVRPCFLVLNARAIHSSGFRLPAV